MYISLHWKPVSGADPEDVQQEVMAVVDDFPFANGLEATEGHYLANVLKGHGSGDVYDLEDALRAVADGRFTFLLVYASRGSVILHSNDVADDALRDIADY
jgi:hypothetical protein